MVTLDGVGGMALQLPEVTEGERHGNARPKREPSNDGEITTSSNALVSTRETLHRVAAHVLGRRRYEVTGRFGLRVTPGGFGTPAFGDGPELLRVVDTMLVHESAAGAAYMPIAGSTLRGLVRFAGADMAMEFSCGPDTPEVGDVDAPLMVDTEAVALLAGWYTVGSLVLDRVLAGLPAAAAPTVVQLWPEHFDTGTEIDVGGSERVGIGASPGDAACAEPYLYLNPGDDRPGDPDFWNTTFGAILRRSEIQRGAAGVDAGVRFIRRGLAQLRTSAPKR